MTGLETGLGGGETERRAARGRCARAVLPVAAAALAAFAAGGTPAARATTRSFRQVTAKDFEEGEATGSTVLPVGEIVPGLVTARVPAIEAAFVWCATLSRDGATAYFGTGDAGEIFAVPARVAPAGDEPSARRLAVLDGAWVTTLATRADGMLLAGTTPGGRVFLVDPKTGAARVLAAIGAGHVWALVRDDRARITYVGSGAPGKIFAVDDSGQSRQVWDAKDKHVVSLMADADGSLLAGTSEDAILYRVHPDGRAEALQDFEAEEVRSVVRAPAGLFVAVNDFEKAPAATTPPPGPVAARGTRIVLGSGGPPASAGSLPRPGARKAKSAIYWIDAAGRIEQVFALADGYLTALAVAEDGSVFAAAGTQGHVYRVRADRTASLVVDLPERQALALVGSGATLFVGTGDVGGVYRARPATAKGRYLSKVLDAEYPARWGMLRWMGHDIAFETRSGNTAKPTAGWSAWAPLEKIEREAAGGAGSIVSPAARYVQYRATLAGAASRLRGVTTYFLPQNQRARITEIGIGDASSATGTGGASATASARAAHSSILKLRWKVDNPDGDELVYRVSYREQGEPALRPLAGVVGDPLTKPEYDWNTEGIPDGLYVVRVTASDERAQPRDRALASSLESPPLLVDNRKPEIRDLVARYPVLSGRARDDASPITQIEISIDGGDWQLVSPTDGLADDLVEAFSIRLPDQPRGPHAVAIRATDSADNVGAAQITVRVP